MKVIEEPRGHPRRGKGDNDEGRQQQREQQLPLKSADNRADIKSDV